jgi:exopolyphosphatase/guanosine-5'-triphosphate,3'-diphosphate pyrophosphatase
MRVAVIDMGTNSTRLLVADVEGTKVAEVERRNTVTRLGRGVDLTKQLSGDAIEDVCDAVGGYIDLYRDLGAERVSALATSAVRDASNGSAFMAELRERFALDARVITGEEEAGLTYLGANANEVPSVPTLVVDIGGGSTEIVCGLDREIAFHTSLQVGTVRHTERHLSEDPPSARALEELAGDVRSDIAEAIDGQPGAVADKGIAVAGTPTSLAAIDLELDPYDPDRVHGHILSRRTISKMLSRLSTMSLPERLRVPGLLAGRAPTIVAGVVILVETMRAFDLEEIEASEHDILWGAALSVSMAPA